MKRNSFVFYGEWMKAIRDLPNDIRLDVYESVIEYATTGNIRGLKPMANIAFNFIKTAIDRDAEKYVSIVERNKENGAKGGRPKNPEKPKKPSGLFGNPEKPKKPDNDNDNDNDIITPPISSDEDIVPPQKTDDDVLFENFQKWLNKNAPNVQRLKEPFTKEQYLRIRKEFDKDIVTQTILKMHNWKDLTRKNVSANLTFRTWVAKDNARNN